MNTIPNGFSKFDIIDGFRESIKYRAEVAKTRLDIEEINAQRDILKQLIDEFQTTPKEYLVRDELVAILKKPHSWAHGYRVSDVAAMITNALRTLGRIDLSHSVFETASVGGTSSGSIASVVAPMGTTQKRKKKMNKPAKNALDQDVSLLGGPAYKRSSGIYEGILEANLPGYDDWKQNPYAHEPSEENMDEAWRSAKTYFDKFLTTDEAQRALNDIRNPDTDSEDRAGFIQDLTGDLTGVIRNNLVNQDGVDYIDIKDIASYVRRRLRTEQDIQGSFTEANNHDVQEDFWDADMVARAFAGAADEYRGTGDVASLALDLLAQHVEAEESVTWKDIANMAYDISEHYDEVDVDSGQIMDLVTDVLRAAGISESVKEHANDFSRGEDEDDKIYFTIDDEDAYEAVMNQYNDYVDWSGDYLTASPEAFGRIEDLVYSMGSMAVEKGSEGFAETNSSEKKAGRKAASSWGKPTKKWQKGQSAKQSRRIGKTKSKEVNEISKKKLQQYVDAAGADDQMGKDREKGSRLATNKMRASQKSTKKNPQKYSKVVSKDASAIDKSAASTKHKPRVAATEGKKKGIVGYNDGSAMCNDCERHWDKDEIKGTVSDLRQSHNCKDRNMKENDLPGYDAWKTRGPSANGQEQYEADQEALPAVFDVAMDHPKVKAMRDEIQGPMDADDREGLIKDYMSEIASYMLDVLADAFEDASVIEHNEVLEWVKGQFYGTKSPRDMPKSMVGLKSKTEAADPNQLKGKDKMGKATKQGPYLKHPAQGKLVGEDIVESILHLSGIKKDK